MIHPTILPYGFNEISLDQQTKIITDLKKAFTIPADILDQINIELIKLNIESFLETELDKLLKIKKTTRLKKVKKD